MENNSQTITRNFESISPSAMSLLFMKAHTGIPFLREAAELLKESFQPDFENRDVNFWARLVHFENRYWSIDSMIDDLPVKNILELSSGFSFRGLSKMRKSGYYYIDTDLPEIVGIKKGFLDSLKKNVQTGDSTLETLELNALDEDRFREIVRRFPPGEIVIVNEGLLMYLNQAEKEKLCGIIRKILLERGGYWVTADIYIKTGESDSQSVDSVLNDFLKRHAVEKNKFDSFDAALSFFKQQGFTVDKEDDIGSSRSGSLQYLKKSLSVSQLTDFRDRPAIRKTWRLKV